MKPYQILLFLFSIFSSLFLLTLVFPDGGIRLSDTLSLKFTKLDDLLINDTVHYAEIQGIIENYDILETFEEPARIQIEDQPEISDSSIYYPSTIKVPECPLELSPDNPKLLFPVFKDLLFLNGTKDLIRILHYGDSQIELDRITSLIRNKLQKMFGGSGLGLLTPVPYDHGNISVIQAYSQNWERYTGFIKTDSSLGHKRFGAMFSFAKINTSKTDKPDERKSWLRFSPSRLGYQSSRIFNNVSLFLTNRADSASLKIMVDDSLFENRIIPPHQSLSRLNWSFTKTPRSITLLFEGNGKPELYGISFDHSWGVAVDNIPLRGSSGLFFSKTDTAFLLEMYKKLNVKMIILQFGGNIVPMNAPNYGFYESYFRRELNLIKELLPEIPVIVIGPSDMSVKEGDKFVTYPSLIKVRDALKIATLNSGYAFWDMYEAMGGENSMPSWVNADPPLAAPDFVHFNARGAGIIAEMFYNAFMYEYYKWIDSENINVKN